MHIVSLPCAPGATPPPGLALAPARRHGQRSPRPFALPLPLSFSLVLARLRRHHAHTPNRAGAPKVQNPSSPEPQRHPGVRGRRGRLGCGFAHSARPLFLLLLCACGLAGEIRASAQGWNIALISDPDRRRRSESTPLGENLNSVDACAGGWLNGYCCVFGFVWRPCKQSLVFTPCISWRRVALVKSRGSEVWRRVYARILRSARRRKAQFFRHHLCWKCESAVGALYSSLEVTHRQSTG